MNHQGHEGIPPLTSVSSVVQPAPLKKHEPQRHDLRVRGGECIFSALRLLSLFTVEDNSALSVLGVSATGDVGILR